MHPTIRLMSVYIVLALVMQGIGFFISAGMNHAFPTLGLITFLAMFLGAFVAAWPAALYLTQPKGA